ncbi:MAG: PKD domain-containing protein [Gaiellaceae bacterium]
MSGLLGFYGPAECPNGVPDSVFGMGARIAVAPHGSKAFGDSISGTTVVTSFGTNAFQYEMLGYALQPGDYDLVYDECNDGTIDPGIDSIQDSFTVEGVPMPSPTEPGTAFHQNFAWLKDMLKTSAYAKVGMAATLKTADAAYESWKLAGGIAEFTGSPLSAPARAACVLADIPLFGGVTVSGALDCAYMWARQTAIYAGQHILEIGIGALTVVDVELFAKAIEDSADADMALANDPPDASYAIATRLGATAAERQVAAGSYPALLRDAARDAENLGALNTALTKALERYSGALAVGDYYWSYLHLEECLEYSRLLEGAYAKQKQDAELLKETLLAEHDDIEAVQEMASDFRQSVLDGTINEKWRLYLSSFGVTDAQLQAVASASPSTTVDELISAFSTLAEQSDSLGAAEHNVSNVLLDAEDAAGTMKNPVPQVNARSGYSGVSGTPIAFSATARLPYDVSATYEWDFDNDGAYEAQGETVERTYAGRFSGYVTVKCSLSNGETIYGAAPVEVASSNHAPTITKVDGAFIVDTNTAQHYQISVSDEDGDPVSEAWYLDGSAVGSGADYTFSPGIDDVGSHDVVVVASDGKDDGIASTQWLVVVAREDADADGWRANVDCNDSDPTVNPGQTEIDGNLKDDDCDVFTPDINPITASFSHDPASIATGRPVSFADTSTDLAGTITSWHWSFGDGETSTEQNPSHTFATPGSYTVKLSVTDDQGIKQSVSETIAARAPPQAAFSVAQVEHNAALLDDAATVVASSTSATTRTPEEAIDATSSTAWYAAGSAGGWLKIRLAGGREYVINKVVLGSTGPPTGLAGFEVAVSTIGTDNADFSTVYRGTLWRGNALATYTFAPVRAKYVLLRMLSNYGGSTTDVAYFQVWTREGENGLVSQLGGPPSAVTAVSSQDAGSPATFAIDDKSATGWLAWNSFPFKPQWLKIKLSGGELYTLNRVRIANNNASGANVKQFEVRVSSTTDDDGAFATVLTATNQNVTGVQEFSFAPVEARYVEFVALSTNTSSTAMQLNGLQFITTDGANASALNGLGSYVAETSSSTGDANAAIDSDPVSTGWTTPTGQKLNQWLTVRLLNSNAEPILVDQVRLQSTAGDDAIKNFVIRTSSTTKDPAAFTTVLTGQLAKDGRQHVYPFDDAQARYVQLFVIDTWGPSGGVSLRDFRVYSPSRGNSSPSFENFSANGEGSTLTYLWDFGDGSTSTDTLPSHSYAAPGTYTVTLTATDETGLTDEVSKTYTVLVPPTADFTWTPATVSEGQAATFTDRSSGDRTGIVSWQWGGASVSGGGSMVGLTFNDNGVYPVTLTVTDNQLQTASVTKMVEVVNQPPVINSLAIYDSFYWGDPVSFGAANVSDPGAADRGSLHCSVSWGDSDTTELDNCSSQSLASLRHTYGTPGTYTIAATVRDKDGGTATKTTSVVVKPRDTVPSFLNSVRSLDGGFDVALRLYETAHWTPVGGEPVSIDVGSARHEIVTDADGYARLHVPAGTTRATATYAGNARYVNSSSTHAVGGPRGDIIFVIDESGSMNSDIAAVRRRVTQIALQLGSKLEYRLGLVGFADWGAHSQPQGSGHIHSALSDDLAPFVNGLSDLGKYPGGIEAGFNATVKAMSDPMGFRTNSGACEILITNEDVDWDLPGMPENREDAVAALKSRKATWFGVVSNSTSTGAEAGGKAMSVLEGYGPEEGSLSQATGGAVFDLGAFESNPDSVLTAILGSCAEKILTPDLELALSDGSETAPSGGKTTYTLTATNASANTATGISLVYTLPADATLVSASEGGSLTDGRVTWPSFSLAAGDSAERTVTIKVARRPAGTTLTASATITDDGANGADPTPANNEASDTDTLVAGNEPPVADDTTVDVNEDAQVFFSLPASDPDEDELTYEILQAPERGTLTGTPPTLTYTPSPAFHGADSFTYRANDGELNSNVATVSVTVHHVNHAPSVSLPNSETIEEGSTLAVTPIAFDADGDSLSYSWTTDVGSIAPSLVGETAVFGADDGPAVAHVTANVSDGALSGSATAAVTVRNVPPTATVGPDVTIVWGLPVRLSSSATDPSAADTQAGFDFAWVLGDEASASGASVDHAYIEPGSFTATASATDKDGGTGSASLNVTVTKRSTNLTYAGPKAVFNESATLSAKLKDESDADTAKLSGRSVLFSIAGETLTGTTDENSVASVTAELSASALGPQAISVSFPGDDLYSASSTEKNLTVFGLPTTGVFAIGDKHPTESITFWGSQWAKRNPLSNGSAPSSFKGFVNRAGLPACDAPWSTSPGNSSDPPDSVPTYMGVIVADSITKSGSTISGNSKHIVVVKPDPGYGPSPGHAGTGLIVASIC